jgi:hypothetical protein
MQAQLPVVYAVGGGGTDINWAQIKAEEEADEYGPGFFYHDCAQGCRPIKASSVLSPQGSKDYGIENLNDDDPMTAWVEGVKGYGIGEWFELKAMSLNVIYNGYQSSPKNWLNNSRVKTFKVFIDGEPLCLLELKDEMGQQQFELPHDVVWDQEHVFRFEIKEVYKGIKWDDVCISHIDFFGCCVHEDSRIMLADGNYTPINTLAEGTEIRLFSEEEDIRGSTTVLKRFQQTHLSLLEVSTEFNSVKITPSHSLYIKDMGFISLSRLKSEYGLETWQGLINKTHVLVYDQKTDAYSYQQITDIRVLEGEFKTYTIKNTGENETYIANGFVTRFE